VRLNKRIEDGVATKASDYGVYSPHATVAYVKYGMGAKYIGLPGLNGQTIAINAITLSNKDKEQTLVHLGELRAAAKTLRFKFDVTNKAAVAWAKAHAAELVTQVSDTTRGRVNAAIAKRLESGDDARDTIEAAVGDEERAELIARHESMLAVSEGQRQAWDQAVDAGLLPADAERVWIAVGDGLMPETEICNRLDGKTARLGEPYEVDGEEVDGPPAHVNCRCTEGIV
jgi:hypothetical protein